MLKCLLSGLLILSGPVVFAKQILVSPENIINFSIRSGIPVFPDSLVIDDEAEVIEFPDINYIPKLRNYNLPNVKKIIVNEVGYIPSEAFSNLPNLEEIVIKGPVVHFDRDIAANCPRLKLIEFNESVISTGSPTIVRDCPNLQHVYFRKPILSAYIEPDPTITFATELSDADREKAVDRIIHILKTDNNYPFNAIMYEIAEKQLPAVGDSVKASELTAAMEYMMANCWECKPKLDILKESPEYVSGSGNEERFVYARPDEPDLIETRLRFNLDSIAGNGDDISQIKNILYWVHNNIRHDGYCGIPEGPCTLANIYDSVNANNSGTNCRGLAIALAEAYLAMGIPARYVTCEPRDLDRDTECHVICVAWSKSLGKWVWVDPTMASYITDENGLLLHPGEVRYRLINDLPLVLNEDANYNNTTPQTKEYYLETYMAKNLYFISANMVNKFAPEGPGSNSQNKYAVLTPVGGGHPEYYINTTDDSWFWQAPE